MTKNLMMVCEAKLVTENADAEPTGKIEARVTTWGAREGSDGRKFFYKPEGFMSWAEEFSQIGRPLPMFVNHDAEAIPVGEWTSFEFDDDGMTANGRMFINTTAGSDLYQIMQESPTMFGGVSVGAYAEEYQWVKEDGTPMNMDSKDEEGYFQITQGGLREVSVVMYPNNPQANIQKLEMFDAEGHLNIRHVEKTLREAGLSRKDATTASLVFKKAIDQREAVNEVLEETPNQSDSDAVATEADALLDALVARELAAALDKRLS